jgi:ubiquitin-activating enzyme E1 C
LVSELKFAHSSLKNQEDGELDQSSVIPIVDGGTEGFRGNVRVILPGLTACVECTLDLFPPQASYGVDSTY